MISSHLFNHEYCTKVHMMVMAEVRNFCSLARNTFATSSYEYSEPPCMEGDISLSNKDHEKMDTRRESTFDDFTRLNLVSSGFTIDVEHCPMCHLNKAPFICQQCVKKGNFYYPNVSGDNESYAEKLQRYWKLKAQEIKLQQRLSSKISEVLSAINEKEAQKSELVRRVCLRKQYLEKQREDVTSDQEALSQLIKKVEERSKRAKVHQHKLDKITKYIEQSKKYLSQSQSKLEDREQRLCDIRKHRLKQMTQYLFPVSLISRSDVPEVKAEETKTSSVASSKGQKEDYIVIAKLTEARTTSYVRGKWVYTDDSQETQYSIVHPSVCLPANGEYSAFTAWIISQEDPYTNLDLHNPGHQTLAAFSYVTQLTSHLAFCLGIPLPKRLHFSYFCLKELGLKEFSCAVEKLNINILYLCCSQGVDSDYLHPHSPLCNLMQLIQCDSSFLGRSLPFQIYADMFQTEVTPPSSATSLTSEISNLAEALVESESSSDESGVDQEWETVLDVDVSLIPSDTTLSTADGSSQAASSNYTSAGTDEQMESSNMSNAAGSLVSSAATMASALWRVASRQYDKS